VAAGIPGIGFLTRLTALVQERTGDAYVGRVFATYYGTFNGLMALGMLLAGLLGDAVGVVPLLNRQAGLYLLAGVVAVATLGGMCPAGYRGRRTPSACRWRSSSPWRRRPRSPGCCRTARSGLSPAGRSAPIAHPHQQSSSKTRAIALDFRGIS
jgi:hypothetical protein